VGLLLTLEILFTPINPIVQMQINGIGNVPGPHKQVLSFPRLMWLKWEEVREVWTLVLWVPSEIPANLRVQFLEFSDFYREYFCNLLII
jgi:hypothetical protein